MHLESLRLSSSETITTFSNFSMPHGYIFNNFPIRFLTLFSMPKKTQTTKHEKPHTNIENPTFSCQADYLKALHSLKTTEDGRTSLLGFTSTCEIPCNRLNQVCNQNSLQGEDSGSVKCLLHCCSWKYSRELATNYRLNLRPRVTKRCEQHR